MCILLEAILTIRQCSKTIKKRSKDENSNRPSGDKGFRICTMYPSCSRSTVKVRWFLDAIVTVRYKLMRNATGCKTIDTIELNMADILNNLESCYVDLENCCRVDDALQRRLIVVGVGRVRHPKYPRMNSDVGCRTLKRSIHGSFS
jgi:hypothetical protein